MCEGWRGTEDEGLKEKANRDRLQAGMKAKLYIKKR